MYLLNTKLQKYVLNDLLGENQEMNLINFITRGHYRMGGGEGEEGQLEGWMYV